VAINKLIKIINKAGERAKIDGEIKRPQAPQALAWPG
jgi:hypothetical protein